MELKGENSKNKLFYKLADLINDEECQASTPIEIVKFLIEQLDEVQIDKALSEFNRPIWN